MIISFNKSIISALTLAVFMGLTPVKSMETPLIRWDDPNLGLGIHIHSSGKDKRDENWFVREVAYEDLSFYQSIFGNTDVIKYFGSGKPTPPDTIKNYIERCVKNYEAGSPKEGVMTLIDKNNIPLGAIALCASEKAGVGTIMRIFDTSSQGRGLGTSTLKFLVDEWAPVVRLIGLGLDKNTSPQVTEKFKCFEGEALKKLDTSARPLNVASWACYKHAGFNPSQPTDVSHEIRCESWEHTLHGSLEDFIDERYFSQASPEHLTADVLYSMLDEKGNLQTISFHSAHNSLRYHYERNVYYKGENPNRISSRD